MRTYEEAIVDRFDHSFLVSDIDRRHLFADQPGKLSRVSVFSNGVALDAMPYQFDARGRDIVFIGNMFSLQNFDAALYMAADVLPLVRKVRPEARLRLIGRIQPDQAAQLNAFDGVDVTGEVPGVVVAARAGRSASVRCAWARACRTRCWSTWRWACRPSRRRWDWKASMRHMAGTCSSPTAPRAWPPPWSACSTIRVGGSDGAVGAPLRRIDALLVRHAGADDAGIIDARLDAGPTSGQESVTA